MSYYTKRTVEGEFDEVYERVTEALADEGFGVLSDIDVQATFQKKLGLEDYRRYRILGACNPPLARDGLEEEIDLGALLPCNVALYETDEGDVVVSAVDPNVLLSVTDNPELEPIQTEVDERLDRVMDAVATA